MHTSPDRQLDALARRQHGAFNRAQALGLGFTAHMVEHRLATGAWAGLDRSVYALTSHPATWERQLMAATLAIEGAVVTGRSAAALHRIEGFRPGAIEITVPRAHRRARSRLASVRSATTIQTTRIGGITCATIAQTLLDLAALLPAPELERAVESALVQRLCRLGELQRLLTPSAEQRRAGTSAFRDVLDALDDGREPPTSELERLLRKLLRGSGLPAFDFEVGMPWWPAGQGRVDAYAAGCSLIVEADGRRWHAREQDFARDRQRDNLAAAHGHTVLRLTWHDLTSGMAASRQLVRATARARRFEAPLTPSQRASGA